MHLARDRGLVAAAPGAARRLPGASLGRAARARRAPGTRPGPLPGQRRGADHRHPHPAGLGRHRAGRPAAPSARRHRPGEPVGHRDRQTPRSSARRRTRRSGQAASPQPRGRVPPGGGRPAGSSGPRRRPAAQTAPRLSQRGRAARSPQRQAAPPAFRRPRWPAPQGASGGPAIPAAPGTAGIPWHREDHASSRSSGLRLFRPGPLVSRLRALGRRNPHRTAVPAASADCRDPPGTVRHTGRTRAGPPPPPGSCLPPHGFERACGAQRFRRRPLADGTRRTVGGSVYNVVRPQRSGDGRQARQPVTAPPPLLAAALRARQGPLAKLQATRRGPPAARPGRPQARDQGRKR
jgi:hypothetical protein